MPMATAERHVADLNGVRGRRLVQMFPMPTPRRPLGVRRRQPPKQHPALQPASTRRWILRDGTEPMWTDVEPESQLDVDRCGPESQLDVDRCGPESQLDVDRCGPESQLDVD